MVDARPSDIDVYATTRDGLVAQLRTLSADEAATVVPSCPAWTVKDVVAHVCGLNAEVLAGVQPPLGSDERTTAQVGDRAQLSLDEVCDEWQRHADPIAAHMADVLPLALGLTADLAVHAHDLAETLDAIDRPAAITTEAGCRRYVPLLQQRLLDEAAVALRIELDDGTSWEPPASADGARALTLRTSPTELLRTVTGRRTRAQAEALDWSAAPAAALDHFTQYGPFRTS